MCNHFGLLLKEFYDSVYSYYTSQNKNKFKSDLEIRMKYCIFLFSILGLVSCTENRSDQRLRINVCPDNWITIGTGCYLFAIPEILKIDESCKVDGITPKCFYKLILILIIHHIIISNVSPFTHIYEHLRLPPTGSY